MNHTQSPTGEAPQATGAAPSVTGVNVEKASTSDPRSGAVKVYDRPESALRSRSPMLMVVLVAVLLLAVFALYAFVL
jgi:hypothetical protein